MELTGEVRSGSIGDLAKHGGGLLRQTRAASVLRRMVELGKEKAIRATRA